ncbi:hypothetical protein ALQ39_200018 [Pseudomonas amygdali pv. eriobotryae]|uniref:Uncharacterized protein n=1 Tax=Pseudomonas amygdali pv. eriobotryae TaxID=129137 RepID=A0A3M3X7Y4_PSEA0|nr:hypothetical protein ALQ39_200018 [Pseudomonas amygdali pv. eriobotryae]
MLSVAVMAISLLVATALGDMPCLKDLENDLRVLPATS